MHPEITNIVLSNTFIIYIYSNNSINNKNFTVFVYLFICKIITSLLISKGMSTVKVNKEWMNLLNNRSKFTHSVYR